MDKLDLRELTLFHVRGWAIPVVLRMAPFFLLLALLAPACRDADTEHPRALLPPDPRGERPPGPRKLSASAPTLERLAQEFLNLLAVQDVKGIGALRLSRDEFCEYVWPELPSSRIPNATCDWVWSQATLKSDAGFHTVISKYNGKRLSLVSLAFAGEDTYETFKVHNRPRIRVRDEAGAEHELRLFGSMLEMDGQFKLFSFVVD